jgi:hypothetical protein
MSQQGILTGVKDVLMSIPLASMRWKHRQREPLKFLSRRQQKSW